MKLLVLLLVSAASAKLVHRHTYAITNVANKEAITGYGKNWAKGAPTVLESYRDEDSQKWTALYANSGHLMKNGNTSEHFYLLPHRQAWNWENTTTGVELTLDWFKELKTPVVVLTLDHQGNLTQEILNKDNDSSQRWISENVGDGKFYLRNVGNNQCVKNFDFKPTNLLLEARRRIASWLGISRKKKDPSPLGVMECNVRDVSEKWIFQEIP